MLGKNLSSNINPDKGGKIPFYFYILASDSPNDGDDHRYVIQLPSQQRRRRLVLVVAPPSKEPGSKARNGGTERVSLPVSSSSQVDAARRGLRRVRGRVGIVPAVGRSEADDLLRDFPGGRRERRRRRRGFPVVVGFVCCRCRCRCSCCFRGEQGEQLCRPAVVEDAVGAQEDDVAL